MTRGSELRALAACAAAGAAVTAGPWFAMGMPLDRILLVPAIQIAGLWAVWALCLSRRVSWLSREWSPFAVGVAGTGAGLLIAAAVLAAVHRLGTGEPFPKAYAAALVGTFWFCGWFATLAVGFLGGLTLGFALRPSHAPKGDSP